MRCGTVAAITLGALAWAASPAAGAPRIDRLDARTPGPGAAAGLDVTAVDPHGVMSGVRIDRADGSGSVAGSACRLGGATAAARGGLPAPFRRAAPVAFGMPFPGTPVRRVELHVTVTSGGCGAPAASDVRTFTLTAADLRPGGPLAAGRTPRAAALACLGADLVPTGRTRRLVRLAVLCLLNAERARAGLAPLRDHTRLRRAALRHSVDMNRRAYFAHEGPGGPALPERLTRVRARMARAGENIAAATGELATARATVAAWMQSAGHRANVLEAAFTHVGVGVATAFPAPPSTPGGTYTAVFGARG